MDQYGNRGYFQQSKKPCINDEKPTYLTKYEQFISNLARKSYNYVENTSIEKEKEIEKKTTNKSISLPPPKPVPPETDTKISPSEPISSNTGDTSDTLSVSILQKLLQHNSTTSSASEPISNSPRLRRKRRLADDGSSGEKLQSISPSTTVSCGAGTTSTEELLTILEDEPMKAYECQICSFETIYESSFREHMLTHKKTRKETFHKCPKCSFRMKCNGSVKKHMVVNKKSPTEAVYCGLYSYSDECKVALTLHLRVHKDNSIQDLAEHEYTCA